MSLIEKIKSFLGKKTDQEICNLKDRIRVEFGFEDFLYATSEGLPIIGTSENCEEMAAFLPEIIKALSKIEDAQFYMIKTSKNVHVLIKVTSEVILFGKGSTEIETSKIRKLIEISKNELGLT